MLLEEGGEAKSLEAGRGSEAAVRTLRKSLPFVLVLIYLIIMDTIYITIGSYRNK